MLHKTTFDYLKPTDEQIAAMAEMREAAKAYALVIENVLPDGPDKTYCLRTLRGLAMWVNVAITRNGDGEPRS